MADYVFFPIKNSFGILGMDFERILLVTFLKVDATTSRCVPTIFFFLGKSDDRVSGMRDMKRDMRAASAEYLSAAKHATILYLTIQQLVRINRMKLQELKRIIQTSGEGKGNASASANPETVDDQDHRAIAETLVGQATDKVFSS